MLRLMTFFIFILNTSSIEIGKINNHVMTNFVNQTLVNLTQNQCICQMIRSNQTILGLNYFSTNQICQILSSNINANFIIFNPNSVLIFRNQTFMSRPSTIGYLWTFDSTYQDTTLTFNGSDRQSQVMVRVFRCQ